MKYSFMSFSAPGLGLQELLGLAARLGYDGIEPRSGSGHAHGIELERSAAERRAIREQAEAHGVALCCIATSCRYADPETVEHWINETRRSLRLVADVGAPRLRVFGGAIPRDVSRAAAIDGVAEALRSVAGEAEQQGVAICLETHDDWTDPEDVAAVLRRVDSRAVGANWDYQHTIRVAKTSVDQAFGVLEPWIKHVHFHDGADLADKLVFLPIGSGDFPQRRVLQLLVGAGYDGYLSGEWIDWEPYEVHLPRELAAIREIEAGVRGTG